MLWKNALLWSLAPPLHLQSLCLREPLFKTTPPLSRNVQIRCYRNQFLKWISYALSKCTAKCTVPFKKSSRPHTRLLDTTKVHILHFQIFMADEASSLFNIRVSLNKGLPTHTFKDHENLPCSMFVPRALLRCAMTATIYHYKLYDLLLLRQFLLLK